MIVILLSFIVYAFSLESSLSLFYISTLADISATAGLATVPFLEKERGITSPAFLAALRTSSVSASLFKDYYGKGYYNFLSYTYLIDDKSGFSVSYSGYSSGSEEVYHIDGSISQMVFEKDYLIKASYGRHIINNLYSGVSIKYLSSILAEKYSSSSFAFDLDAVYNTINLWYIRGGFENISGKIKYIKEEEKFPLFFNFEISKIFDLNKTIVAGGVGFKKSSDYKILAGGGSVFFTNLPISLNFGCSKHKDMNRYSLGVGVIVENINLNIAYIFPDIFNSNDLRFSLTYFFEEVKPELRIKRSIKKQNYKNTQKDLLYKQKELTTPKFIIF